MKTLTLAVTLCFCSVAFSAQVDDSLAISHPGKWIKVQKMRLVGTPFTAKIGPLISHESGGLKPDYYRIHVQVVRSDGVQDIYFQREIPILLIPKGLEEKKIQDVVSYNPLSRVVTFNIGDTKYHYNLPKNIGPDR